MCRQRLVEIPCMKFNTYPFRGSPSVPHTWADGMTELTVGCRIYFTKALEENFVSVFFIFVYSSFPILSYQMCCGQIYSYASCLMLKRSFHRVVAAYDGITYTPSSALVR